MLDQGFSEINTTYFILTPLLLIYFSFSLFTLILSISFSFQWSDSHLWLKPFQWFILLKNLKGKHLEKSKMKFPFPISFFSKPWKDLIFHCIVLRFEKLKEKSWNVSTRQKWVSELGRKDGWLRPLSL